MPTRQKILLYTDTPLYGGAERQTLLLAKNLDQQKFEPIIVCRFSENLQDWYKQLEQAGLKTYITKTRSKNSLSNLWQLLKIIRTEKPDLIHAQIWNPVASKFAFLATKFKKIPLIITEHDPFQLGALRKLYKKFSLKIPKKIITVSHSNQNLMSDLYPQHADKITTVHNGIDQVPKALSDSLRLKIRKELFHASPQTTIIFSAGTLHQRKGYKYLIGAYKKICANLKLQNHKLIIAGEGPERPALEKLIQNLDLGNKVVLLGQRTDILDLMQASDIFILPSLKEAFGLVILEAMQSGLPVIASQVGGIPEIISADNLGLLTKAADKNSLIKALTKLLSDTSLRSKLKTAGIAHCQNFSAKKMAKQTEKIYTEILTK